MFSSFDKENIRPQIKNKNEDFTSLTYRTNVHSKVNSGIFKRQAMDEIPKIKTRPPLNESYLSLNLQTRN